uniref:Portal protein n=1 Tax=viral metagenome TaxID=1070528 RepID=A0A6H1ZVT8_9ZZZZ
MVEIKDMRAEVEDVEIKDNNMFSDQIEFESESKKADFINKLIKDIDATEDDKQELIDKNETVLKAINLEPEDENKMTPWENASNYRDFLTSNTVNIIYSVLSQTMLTNPLWIVKLPFDEQYETFLDQGLNFYAFNFLRVEDPLKQAIKLAIYETTSFVEISDQAEERPITTTQEFTSIKEFVELYPDEKSLNVKNKGEYNQFIDEVADNIVKFGNCSLELSTTIRDVNVTTDVYNIDETCVIPWNSTSVETARGILFKIKLKDEDLKRYAKSDFNGRSYFDPEAVEKTVNSGATDNTSSYEEKKNKRLGTSYDISEIEDRLILKGVYKAVLNEDDGEEEFYIHFAYNERQLLRIERYRRTRGKRNIVALSPIPVHRSIIGESLPARLTASQNLVDTFWNMMVDNNKLANIPTFAVSTKEVGTINSSFENWGAGVDFEPGTTLYVSDYNAFKQLQTSPMDMRSVLNYINIIYRNSETNTGAVQMLSGRENPNDPNAPGNKTAMQLFQANRRLDEYIRALRASLTDIGEILLYKLVEIQPDAWKKFQIKYVEANMQKDGKELAILSPQEIWNKKIVIDVRAQSVEYNRTTLAGELQFLIQSMMSDPRLAQNPMGMEILYRKYFNYFNLSNREIEDLLIPFRVMSQQMRSPMPGAAGPPPMPPAPLGMGEPPITGAQNSPRMPGGEQ